MKRLLHPTNEKILGPLLIENNYVIQLDSLADKIMQKATEFNNSEIEDKVASSHLELLSISNTLPYCNEKREFIIEFLDKTQLIGNSINDLVRNPEIQYKKVYYLRMIIERGNFIFELEINKRKFTGPLEYNIKCKDNELALDVKYEVDRWLKPFKPSSLMNFWKFALLLWIPFLMFFYSLERENNILKEYSYINNKIEATNIVHKHVNDSSINRAIELLLIKNYNIDYINKQIIENQKRNAQILLFSMLILLFLSISPSTNIGIGKGEPLIKRWKIYIKVAFVFIPLNIILPIIINLLTK
jgi:hypothetical protein